MPSAGDVLVVDDDDLFRVLLSRVLDRAGYAVRTAVDATTAIAALGSSLPALILLDITIPGGSEAVVAWIRAHNPNLPIVFMSGLGQLQEPVVGVTIIGSLGKPFESQALFSYVARYVEKRERGSTAE